MTKRFESKKRLKRKWLLEYLFLLLFAYLLIRLCIYTLVDISPTSYFSMKDLSKSFYEEMKASTINNPTVLLSYRGHAVSLKQPLLAASKPSNKKIYLYSTHNKETYQTGEKVTQAALDFKTALNDFQVDVHLEEGDIQEFVEMNNYAYYQSYQASRLFIEDALKKDTYDLIIDLHRDATSKNNSTLKTDEKSYAKVLFVIGGKNVMYRENYAIAEEIHEAIEKKLPKLSRGILVQTGSSVNGIYNQDLNANMILLELGGNQNTYEEVQNTISVIAPIIGEYLYGKAI